MPRSVSFWFGCSNWKAPAWMAVSAIKLRLLIPTFQCHNNKNKNTKNKKQKKRQQPHVNRTSAKDKRDRLTHTARTQLSSSFSSSSSSSSSSASSNLRKQAMVEEEKKMEGKVAPEKRWRVERDRGGKAEEGGVVPREVWASARAVLYPPPSSRPPSTFLLCWDQSQKGMRRKYPLSRVPIKEPN